MASQVNRLLLINQKILNYSGNCGFRNHDVVCLAKTGQTVRFTSPNVLHSQLNLLMENFYSFYEKANNSDSLSAAFSYFWLGFIAIHPFTDGNGRTGKEYISQKIKEKKLPKKNLASLDSILLKGETTKDLQQLRNIFRDILQH
jgi:fido (protein-threonine AMPylation protein)